MQRLHCSLAQKDSVPLLHLSPKFDFVVGDGRQDCFSSTRRPNRNNKAVKDRHRESCIRVENGKALKVSSSRVGREDDNERSCVSVCVTIAIASLSRCVSLGKKRE